MAGWRMGPSVLGSVPGATWQVRASGVVGAGCPVWQAQSESAHEEWGPGRVGVSTGSSWPRPSPTAGRMGCVEAVEEDGTPFESN